MLRRSIDTGTALGLLGLAGAAAAAALRRLGDFDLPWHLATGRAVLAVGKAAASVDDFSYTFRGAPLRPEWLSEALLWIGYRAGGAIGLHVVALIAIGALAVLLVRRGMLQRSNLPLAIAAAALALMASGSWLVLRPALLSFSLFAAALALVERHRRGGSLRGLAWIVPLQLAWAQGHGFAPLGAMAAVGYAIHVALCRAARGRAGGLLPVGEGRDAAGVALVAALAVAATAAGVYGLDAFTTALRFRGYESYITEWTPTTLAFLQKYDPAALVLLAAVALALVFGREPAPDGAPPEARGSRWPIAYELGLLVLVAIFAAWSVRLIPLFAIAAAPVAARRLAAPLAGARSLPLLGAVTGLVAVPALLMSPGARPGLGWDGRNLPVGAAAFVASHHPTGPVFNFMPFGGWLALQLHPEVRVFIDGRTGWLYPRDFLDAYHRALSDPAAFAALQQKWGFSWAIVRSAPGERFSAPIASDPAWTMVYLDDSAAVYVRKDGENRALAAEGYHHLRHLTPPLLALARPMPAGLLDDHDAALAAAQAPGSARAWLFVAGAAMARGDVKTALEAREKIGALDPDRPELFALDRRLKELAERR